MKHLKRLIIVTAITVLVVLGGLVAFLSSTDFTRFARKIEAEIEAETGREVEIKGRIGANLLSLNPEILLNDVRLANAPWGRTKDMATVKQIDIDLRLLPLLSGRIKIQRLTLRAPVIHLETDGKGRANWRFAVGETKASTLELGGSWLKFLEIEDGRITYRSAPSAPVTEMHFKRLVLSADDAASPIRLSAEGSIDGRDVRVSAETGSALDLFNGKESATRFAIKYGTSDLDGKLTVRVGETTSVKGTLQSTLLDLRATRRGESSQQRSEGDGSLPLNALRAGAGQLTVSIKLLRLDDLDAHDGQANVTLAKGVLSAQSLSARLGGGRLAGTIRLDAAATPARLTMSAKLTGANLTDLAALIPLDRTLKGKVACTLEARGTGNTLSAIMDSLGRTSLVVTGQDLTMANTSWGSRTDMVRIKRLELALGFVSLLKNRLQINRLSAIEPDVLLETDGKGRNNWVIPLKQRSGAAGSAQFPPIGRVKIERGRMVYVDRSHEQPDRLTLTGLSASSAATGSQRIRFDTAGVYNSKRFSAKGSFTSLATLFTGRSTQLDFSARSGRSDLSGKLAIQAGDLTSLRGSLSSTRLELGDPTPEAGTKGKLLSDEPLPLGTLRAVSGQMTLRAKTVRMGDLTISGFAATGALKGGVLSVSRLAGTIAKGQLEGRLTLDASARPPRMSADLGVERVVLSQALGTNSKRTTPNDLVDIEIQLKGRGRTLDAIAATANGTTAFVLGADKVKETAGIFEDLGSGLLQAISSVALIRGGPLRCVAFRATFRDGIGKSDVMVVDTERITLMGRGTLNLRNQTVDAIFYPRNKIPLVRRIRLFTVRIHGPMQDPKQTVDFGAAALKTAEQAVGLLKVPFNLARSIFGFKSSDKQAFDPCPDSIASAGVTRGGLSKSTGSGTKR